MTNYNPPPTIGTSTLALFLVRSLLVHDRVKRTHTIVEHICQMRNRALKAQLIVCIHSSSSFRPSEFNQEDPSDRGVGEEDQGRRDQDADS